MNPLLTALLGALLCAATACADDARLPPTDKALDRLSAEEREALRAYFDEAMTWAWRGKGCTYHAVQRTDSPEACAQERALCETQSAIASIETVACHVTTADLAACGAATVGDYELCVSDVAELTRRLLRELDCATALPAFPYAELVHCASLLERCAALLSWR